MNKYRECRECYYQHRSPDICEGCEGASEFEPRRGGDEEEPDRDGIAELKRMVFVPKHREIVQHPDEGLPDWWLADNT